MPTLRTLALSLPLLVAATGCSGADPEAGRTKSAVCAGCHGVDGNSVNPKWPKLAGQHAEYLESALRAYRSGERKETAMRAMAQPLSDEDIADIAAWYASQKQK